MKGKNYHDDESIKLLQFKIISPKDLCYEVDVMFADRDQVRHLQVRYKP